MSMSRRRFLAASMAMASAALAGCAEKPKTGASGVAADGVGRPSRRLVAESRTIEVDGRAANVLRLAQPSGMRGLVLEPGERFAVELENRLAVPTIVHWHGQVPPPEQDGVSQFGVHDLQPGERRAYDFAARPGTYWMHSHQGLQEQRLLAAPLIVRTSDDVRADVQEVTIFLEDFLLRDPAEVLAELRHGEPDSMGGGARSAHHEGNSAMMEMPGMRSGQGAERDAMHAMPGMAGHMSMHMDLNDIDFDAYLANERTLDDPEIVRVERAARVRLRIVNGASATNFHIDLGPLAATVVAVDGNATRPLRANRFELAMAQRIDLLVELPDKAGAWPVLAVREGDRRQTGVILATRGATVRKVALMAAKESSAIGFDQERSLSAAKPLSERAVNARFMSMLTGSMNPYVWGFDGKGWDDRDVVKISAGQRVELTFHNMTMMAHPIHLHGHHFQVVAFNGMPFSGALRDTVMVPPMAKVAVAFDADNPGRWLMHCHNLYHMEAGMMTEVAYA